MSCPSAETCANDWSSAMAKRILGGRFTFVGIGACNKLLLVKTNDTNRIVKRKITLFTCLNFIEGFFQCLFNRP